jgi:glycosyltransferase involved in cell wall biosynthesis
VNDFNTTQPNLNQRFQQGINFASHHDYSQALKIFISLLDINPEQPLVMYNAAVMCDLLGERTSAKEVLINTLQIKPDFPEAHFYLGKIYFQTQEYQIALNHFRETIRYDINHSQAYQYYQQCAEKLNIEIFDSKTDLVFYIIGGRPFHDKTLETEGIGGSESALIYVSRELAALGYRIKVFTNCDNPGIYNNIAYFDLVDFYLYCHFNTLPILIAVRSVKPFELQINAKVKILWIHDNPNVKLSPEILCQIDKIVSVSQFQQQQWSEEFHIPPEKFCILHNGIDSSLFNEYNPIRPGKKLIYTSQPQRGLPLLLELFLKIQQNCPDAELHIFAYSSQSTTDQLQSQYKNQSHIHFHGSVSKQVLANELKSARLFVYPTSFLESFCMAAVEAQAAGVPVVSSAIGALTETIESGKTGILINSDPHSLTYQKIFMENVTDFLKNDDKWISYSLASYQRSRQLYDWKTIALKWDKLLKELHGK